MELELWHYALAIGGGFVAGGINSLAGYGSIITISIMMEVLGMPGNLANGTNRVNILANSIAGTLGYRKGGLLELNKGKWIILSVCLGAILGTYLAVTIDNEQFKVIFKYLVVLLFLSIIVNPKRWMKEEGMIKELPLWQAIFIYFPIGIYGGFIQMGSSLFLMMLMVLISHFTIMQANALKLLIMMIFTVISLAIFHFSGLVNWKIGLIIGAGQAAGSYLTASYASKIKNANVYAYRLLIFVVIIILLKTFGFFKLFI